MTLSGSEKKDLRIALADAYPSEAKLNMLVVEADLSKNIKELALGDDLNEIIFKLISWAESHNKLDTLIQAAYDDNPNNPKLKEFWQSRRTIFDSSNISNNTHSFPEESWKELCLILIEIHIDLLTQTCRSTLENISTNQDVLGAYPELAKLDIPRLKNILLQKCPYNDKQAPTIVEFAERLAKAEEVQQPLQDRLNQWVRTVAKQLNISLPTYSQSRTFFDRFKRALESYLMIVVTPIDKNQVALEAELIPDYKSKDSKVAPVRIDLAENQTNINCSFTKIAETIYSFIRESRKKLKGKKYNLTIEVFLPIKYLNNSIEFDQVIYKDSEVKPIGYEHYFLVRSLERFTTDDEEHLNKLYQRWDILEFLLKNNNEQDIQNKFDFLSEANNYNWDDLETSWLCEEMFGIKVHCLPNSETEQIKFFQTLLRAGVPISLWSRCNNLVDIDTFDNLLTTKSLRNFNHFFESVWKLRRIAYAKPNKASYLGYNLGFLCDNPYRLPFCLMPDNQDLIETGF